MVFGGLTGLLAPGGSNAYTYVAHAASPTWSSVGPSSPSSVSSLLNVNGTLNAGGNSGVALLLYTPGEPANLQAGSTTFASTALSWSAVSGRRVIDVGI